MSVVNSAGGHMVGFFLYHSVLMFSTVFPSINLVLNLELAQDLAVLFAVNITCTLSCQYNIIARAVSIITPNPSTSGTGCSFKLIVPENALLTGTARHEYIFLS